MASMGGADYEPQLRDAAIRTIRSAKFVNRTLQSICQAEGLPSTGVKAVLQSRICDRLTEYSVTRNAAAFNRLKQIIDEPSKPYPPSASAYQPASFASSSSPAANSMALPNNFHPPAFNNMSPAQFANVKSGYTIKGTPRIEFKPSPFYEIQEQLNPPSACEVMAQHRHTVKIILTKRNYPFLSRVESDPSLRVMVFGAADGHGLQDIAFPHQSEIKVNGGEVKANLRGLKNKPGSTRPVDITKDLRLNGNDQYANTVEMTYALTNKRFYLIIYVVKAVPVVDLAKKLENGKRITEESVVNTMVSKARDADIVTTASVLSLKCPLSTLRIDLPCRSIACKHNQCFDATSYLQLQEQGPTWLCPICNNPAVFENLAVDEYVKNILKSTSKSVDQVTIQPDGRWELHSKKEPQSSSRFNSGGDDSDDDLIEITKLGDSIRMGTPRTNGTPNGGQPSQGPASSVMSRESSTVSAKRPRPQVIDLTSSGDEDDEPLVRPTKRQYTSNGSGAPSSSTPIYRPPPPNGFGSRP